jgi:hypothetical protein
MDVSSVRQNASRSIHDNLEFGSIIREPSRVQPEKNFSQITSTDAGRLTDVISVSENASRSI